VLCRSNSAVLPFPVRLRSAIRPHVPTLTTVDVSADGFYDTHAADCLDDLCRALKDAPHLSTLSVRNIPAELTGFEELRSSARSLTALDLQFQYGAAASAVRALQLIASNPANSLRTLKVDSGVWDHRPLLRACGDLLRARPRLLRRLHIAGGGIEQLFSGFRAVAAPLLFVLDNTDAPYGDEDGGDLELKGAMKANLLSNPACRSAAKPKFDERGN
jgi:hypothetical protein